MQEDEKLPSHEFDSPWKVIISAYFEEFMTFFFPYAADQINWSRGFESLDKELETLMRNEGKGKQLVDKLMKVWLKDGEEIWVLIHVEIQGTQEAKFAARMFGYWSTIRQHHRVNIYSCAILTDDRRDWRPNHFTSGLWETRVRFDFPTFKLFDLVDNLEALETSDNPFAQASLAHLRTIETGADDPQRVHFKFHLFRLLYSKGYSRKMILELMAFFDWIMILTPDLEIDFKQKLIQFEEEHDMKYIPSWSREDYLRGRQEGRKEGRKEGQQEGRKEGRQEGRQEGTATGLKLAIIEALAARFGPLPDDIKVELGSIEDTNRLLELIAMASVAESIEAFEQNL